MNKINFIKELSTLSLFYLFSKHSGTSYYRLVPVNCYFLGISYECIGPCWHALWEPRPPQILILRQGPPALHSEQRLNEIVTDCSSLWKYSTSKSCAKLESTVSVSINTLCIIRGHQAELTDLSRRVTKDIFLNLDFLNYRSRGKSLSANFTWEMPNSGRVRKEAGEAKKVVKQWEIILWRGWRDTVKHLVGEGCFCCCFA